MSDSNKLTDQYCPDCSLPYVACYCNEIPKLVTNTKALFIVHSIQRHSPSNTALLAHKCLVNSEMHFRGLLNKPIISLNESFLGYTPLYLFPSEEAVELDEKFVSSIGGKVALVVPDGSWRQARRIHKRESSVKGIIHVKLPKNLAGASQFHLRRQSNAEGVCTFEAITRALSILEGKKNIEPLEKVFEIFVERFLKYRFNREKNLFNHSGN